MPPTHKKKREKKKPIPTAVTERLTVVVTEAPSQRVPLASVCRMYRKGNKEPQLDYGAYGFKKLGSMLDAAPGLCVVVDPARCGNFDIVLDHLSRISRAVSPSTRRAACSTWCPCVWNADGSLQSDVLVTNSGRWTDSLCWRVRTSGPTRSRC